MNQEQINKISADYLMRIVEQISEEDTNISIDISLYAALKCLANGDCKELGEVSLQPVDKWQPIETAPKNRQHFLISDGEFVFLALREGNDIEVFGDECCIFGKQPTHWQPLPAAPAEDLLTKLKGSKND